VLKQECPSMQLLEWNKAQIIEQPKFVPGAGGGLNVKPIPQASPQGWSEAWTAKACDKTVAVTVTYSATADGMDIRAVNYTVHQPGSARCRERQSVTQVVATNLRFTVVHQA
jgi:hypothetical protein